MITKKRLLCLEDILRSAGYGPDIDWTENIARPEGADEFASEAIYVICNSGMANVVAVKIFARCMSALKSGQSASTVFGHPGKRAAIDTIWEKREQFFGDFLKAADQRAYLETLPWIGPVTSFHLAKNLGADVAKPDVHLERLARREKTTTAKLCSRLAKATGYRAATIDSILWRACADRLLKSALYEKSGWRAAFDPDCYTRDS